MPYKKETSQYRSGYGHTVIDFYVERVKEQRNTRMKRLVGLRNRKQAEDYIKNVRKAIAEAFSPLPEKTPLNARITGNIERPGYRVEKVIFESRPGLLVTGNLYLPKRGNGKYPCVLGTCGHSKTGKAEPRYQEFCQRLVKAGFVVFIYDPINQGERDQYFRLPEDTAARKYPCFAHNMMGKQMQLNGDWFGNWRLWDGIRALDFLLGREEIDDARVGITGNSGGGTMTTWLTAMDDRFTMAAPSCFVSSFLSNLENEHPGDAEQCPPGVIGAHLEQADFFIATAPRPVILLGQHYDGFDRRALKEAYAEIKHFYRHFRAEKNVELFIGNNIHGYYPDNQENMVRFFCKHAGLDKPESVSTFRNEPESTLWATPKGNVVAAGSKPVYKMTETIAETLTALNRRKNISGPTLKRRLRNLLAIPAEKTVPHYRNLRAETAGDDIIARYAVETERNIRVIIRKNLTVQKHHQTLDVEKTVNVYLPEMSSEADMKKNKYVRQLMARDTIYAVDVRGMGESRPDEKGDFYLPYGMDYMLHAYGLMLGESYLGRRVFDLLSVIRLLKSEGAAEINLHGRGQGAIITLFAAVIDGSISSVFLKELPGSFLSLTKKPIVDLPAASFPHGILKQCDIQDCLSVLKDKAAVL